jgi:putative DNA primase/helicase
MRENFYPVQAVCALTIAGNAEPRFELVDRAVTRRFLKAPFEHEIGKDEEDTRYPQHLVDREGPGILRWMVEGLLDWMQTRRLFTGAVVDEATREYLEAEDVLATFIRERCEEDAESRLDVKQLYQEWRLAALADGRPPSSQNAITRRLKKLFPKVEMLRSNGQTIALGLRFRAVVIRPAPHIRVVR